MTLIVGTLHEKPYWVTPEGNIYKTTYGSYVSCEVVAKNPQNFRIKDYKITSGSLPQFLSLSDTGNIAGFLSVDPSAVPPTWDTPEGNIGDAFSYNKFQFQFEGTSAVTSTPIADFSLVKGFLPNGLILNKSGFLAGVVDYNPYNSGGNILDKPIWITEEGNIGNLLINSDYSFKLEAEEELSLKKITRFCLVEGMLPLGISLGKEGMLAGKPNSKSMKPIPITEKLPIWVTPCELPWLNTTFDTNFKLVCNPYDNTKTISSFSVVSGNIPIGIYLTNDGFFKGKPMPLFASTSDIPNPPVWETPEGNIGTIGIDDTFSKTLKCNPNEISKYEIKKYNVKDSVIPYGMILTNDGTISGKPNSRFNVPSINEKKPTWVTENMLPEANTTLNYNLVLKCDPYNGDDTRPVVSYSIINGSFPFGITLSKSGVIFGKATIQFGEPINENYFIKPTWNTEGGQILEKNYNEPIEFQFSATAHGLNNEVKYIGKTLIPMGLTLSSSGLLSGTISDRYNNYKYFQSLGEN